MKAIRIELICSGALSFWADLLYSRDILKNISLFFLSFVC
ncbi:hypothetical protein MITSMUL_03967 [Mitsuokella multacida DSM 20544]|uniref:Uncharacterized protein n=1 Tax=Mitsuokella multacida DSM 20544 TaxID=500635 RepID=C9KL68_9FIRM|nr:hypothetical protein MITSMUL_03967 [Mitsuokella multacida DSM 20544]